jgi:RNA polymerase sigma-70 factor (ECF subfamily)
MDAESLYREHVRPVHRYFYYKGVALGDVEDLVQESFFRFFRDYAEREFTEVEIRKILYAISRNVWLEWVRSQVKHQTYELDELRMIPETAEDFVHIEDEVEDERQREQLREAIQNLNPTLRAVLTLRFIEGKTRREIAAELQIKEKDVHTYQKRGIKALHKSIEKTPILEETVPPLA